MVEILRLFAPGEPLYGRQIVEMSNGSVALGSIYIILHRMVRLGYITLLHPEHNPHDRGIPVRFYCVTPEGLDILRRRVEPDERQHHQV